MSRRTLEQLDREGRGPARIQLGRAVAYFRGDLDRWLADRRVEVTP